MRISLSLLLFLFSFESGACQFKKHVSKVYSFSGVTSVALREMGLLTNPVVKGISVFNPIQKSEFSGRRFPAGIYLSHDTFKELGGGVLFYDESREINSVLAPISSIQSIEIKTRGLNPLEVGHLVEKELALFVQGCEKEFSALRMKMENSAATLLQQTPQDRSVVYYLGGLNNGRPPEMIIVQDGVVKWLLQQKKIKTYPSPLAYVNWSAKIMHSMPKNTLHILVKDSGSEGMKNLVKEKNYWVLTYPGSLVPGLTQLEAWNYFEVAASP